MQFTIKEVTCISFNWKRLKKEATISYYMYKENSIQSKKSAPINEKNSI